MSTDDLRDLIDEKITTNGEQEITGAILNNVLQETVDTLADGENLDAGSIKTANIADGAITTDKIADGNVKTGKIEDHAVTKDKLDQNVSSDLDWAVASNSYYRNSQAGDVAAKVITTYKDINLIGGGSLKVTFEQANTADDATLNIDGKGAKPLYYNGARVSSTNSWEAGETVEIYYNNYTTGIYYAKRWMVEPVSVSQNTLTIGGNYAGQMSDTYDVTMHNSGTTFASLEALLSDANLSTLIPTNARKGGMNIKFVQTSDNKYVQARCMAQSFTTDVTQWQVVDAEPTDGSHNLVESGGVAPIKNLVNGKTLTGTASGNYSWLAYGFEYPAGTQVKNNGTTRVNLYETYSTSGTSHTILAGQTIITTYPVRAIRDNGHSGEYEIEFIGCFTEISNLREDIEELNAKQTGLSYTGTASGNYGWLAYGFYAPSGMTVKNDGETQVNLYETYSTSGIAHTIAVGQTIVTNYPVRAIRDDGHSGSYSIKFIGIQSSIDSLNSDVNTLKYKLDSPDYSGTASSTYAWLLDGFEIPTGSLVYNRGAINLNLYENKSNDANSVTLLVGAKLVTTFPIRALRSISMKGAYDLQVIGYKQSIEALENSAKETTIIANTIISKNKATVQASLGNGETISVSTFPKSNEVGDILTLYGEFETFGDGFVIGKGNANISSVYFLIDSTNITPKRYNSSEVIGTPVAHGLTLSTFIKVIVEYTLDGTKVLIHTLNGVFAYTFQDYKEPNGFPRVTSVGIVLNNVVFTCINKNMQNPIWAFGDSYMDFTAQGRELYWLKEWGYLNMLPNAFPGRDSTEALADLNRCLLYGTPKMLIWTLGMNDNQTQGTITTWQNNLNSLISLCQQKGIELILATIPQPKSTSYRNKALMNAVVVASGYRYLDQNKALGANANGEWYGNGTDYDYQSSDNVHPTQYGAKAIATQMLIDIPEIASGKEL